MKPRPTWLGTTWLSRIHFLPSGTAIVSASRLCISTTSMPRSRILLTKSKWSRLALSTQSTSSKRSLSQLLGVRRECARPGAHTITLRNCPTSEWTPSFPSSAMTISFPRLKRDRTRDEPYDAGNRAHNRDPEDDQARRGKDAFALFAPCPDVQNRAGCVENCSEQHELQTARIDQKHRVDDGDPGDDQVSRSFVGAYIIGFAAPGEHETVGGH